ncbi:serine hydrolase domain-containing protein [Streptomyces syringium]|uniref:D-alanyl-D-alanine carboxypeptidase n=1 Tax=Streptomyces syringium TaxID=76729 RepID=A0ABS4XXY2_9ACTN|nr:serine hydrolase domain-containing protein [Streptomyces syringium]MBP2401379.1 D-alanyl-D-alanine carboxypeptidase [Streptomyces syringium]
MTVRRTRTALAGVLTAAAMTVAALATPAAADDGRGDGPHAATRESLRAQVRAGVPGAVGQARDAGGTWNGSAGVADLRTHRPRLPQDRFRIGSLTKAFVSVVLLQQEAEGRLDLDDTVEHWLPGVVRGNGHDGRRITVRQLLNHSSGIFNHTEDPELRDQLTKTFFRHRFDTRTPRQLTDIAMSHRPYFEPGKGWHYSNTNYVLAGMIVEKAAGRPYADEIVRRLIRPLGLRGTSLPGTSSGMPGPHGRAYGKLTFGPKPTDPVHDVTELNPSWGGAAGEMISTPGDLNRFYRALLGGGLLPGAQQRQLLTTVPMGDEIPGGRYGLGVMPATLSCGVDVWFHTGGIHGSGSLAAATPDGRHTAAFNLNGDWAGDLGGLLEAEYCGTKPHTAAKSQGLAAMTALR